MKGKIEITFDCNDSTDPDELTAEVIHNLLRSFPTVLWKLAYYKIEGQDESD